MSSTLHVRVPGPPQLWSLAVNGVLHPVDRAVVIGAGSVFVALQACVPMPNGYSSGRLELTLVVPEGGHVVLALPWPGRSRT